MFGTKAKDLTTEERKQFRRAYKALPGDVRQKEKLDQLQSAFFGILSTSRGCLGRRIMYREQGAKYGIAAIDITADEWKAAEQS